MFDQMSLLDLLSATSSQELASTVSPCAAPVGPMIVRSGRDPARASLSARQAKEKGLLTSGICGPLSTTSSSSVSLQSSLESRLRAAALAYGSILYKLTWKPWVTPSGLSRFRLRASVGRISGTGLSGWPTATATDAIKGGNVSPRPGMMGMSETAPLAGWPTTSCSNDRSARPVVMMREDGTKNQQRLQDFAEIAGWPTPDAGCFNINSSWEVTEARRQKLKEKHGNSNGAGLVIATAALMADWGTTGEPMRLCSDGTLLTGSSAGMESGGRLDPAHSRWLMRLPPVWDDCAVTAMQSMQSSRKSSTRR